jgi:hypothetical protein
MNEITVKGLYKGSDPKGMIIGGKRFTPKNVNTADVVEQVFLNLQRAEENGWFKIFEHNYNKFLEANGREPVKLVIPTTLPIPDLSPNQNPDLTDLDKMKLDSVTSDYTMPTGVSLIEPSVEPPVNTEVKAPVEPLVEAPVEPLVEAPVEPLVEAPEETIDHDVESFLALSTKAQNTAFKTGTVSPEVVKYVIDNEEMFKPATVEYAKQVNQ